MLCDCLFAYLLACLPAHLPLQPRMTLACLYHAVGTETGVSVQWRLDLYLTLITQDPTLLLHYAEVS